MADVKLPGVGPVSKKWLGIVAVGSVVTVGYVLMRRKSKAAAAASSATTATDTIDPATGDIAGSAQDQADLASLQTGGYGSGMYGGGSTLGNYGGYLAASPAGAAIPGSGGFSTNGEWAQQAEADLANPPGLSNALGQYLTARTLNSSDQGLVDQAIAEEGYPPVAGPSGYPPSMHTSPTGGGTTGTPGYQTYAPGGKTLTQLAAADGVTVAQIRTVDPGVYAKYGTSKPLPKGTGYYVPKH
jgi:hypothetical protein